MSELNTNFKKDRLTLKEKNAFNKKWYKDKINELDAVHLTNMFSHGKNESISMDKKMDIWYKLFNNTLNASELAYVAEPFGKDLGNLPARMKNRDIISGKIKSVLGMESKRPFKPTFFAVNKEATTRKEEFEFGKMKDYVISEILKPIKAEAEQRRLETEQNRELSEQEKQEIYQEIEAEYAEKTPDQVKLYMKREHQDPAEVMYNHLINYAVKLGKVEQKLQLAFKHGLISSRQIMYLGIHNDEPEHWVVNPKRFNYGRTENMTFIEDAPYASCEYHFHITDIVRLFGRELTDRQIDILVRDTTYTYADALTKWMDDDTAGDVFVQRTDEKTSTVRAVHCTWKALRRMGFLLYEGEDGEQKEMIVDETYELDIENGDISIEWEWLPETYEGWKLGNNTYVGLGPIKNQIKDINDPYNCKLPYYGIIYDNLNAEELSLVGRLVDYQYLFNILWYRIEMLTASDKGKKVLMNINAVPDSLGIDIEKWSYYVESSPWAWFNPDEEGGGYNDANTVAKVIDLSLVSDINKYVELAEYVRVQAGKSVGITDAVEGQVGPREAVGNNQQNLIQSSHILEPYFALNAIFKANFISALAETTKIAYASSGKDKLAYILDDMSREMIDIDLGLLETSTFGIFYEDSSKAEEIKQTIQQLAHAAMQNGSADMSTILSVLKKDTIEEASETLLVAEDKAREREDNIRREEAQNNERLVELQRQAREEEHQYSLEEIIVREEERRKTVIIQASLTAASFNPDKDDDRDGMNDFVEIARDGLDANIRKKEHDLKREEFQHKKETDREELRIKDKVANNKSVNKPKN